MNEYKPDKPSSPWQSVCDLLLERDTPIDEIIAAKLQSITSVSMYFWLEREKNYRNPL